MKRGMTLRCRGRSQTPHGDCSHVTTFHAGSWFEPCQPDATGMTNAGIFPVSPRGRRKGSRASNLSGSLHPVSVSRVRNLRFSGSPRASPKRVNAPSTPTESRKLRTLHQRFIAAVGIASSSDVIGCGGNSGNGIRVQCISWLTAVAANASGKAPQVRSVETRTEP
jgi:hypothetical protein